jgi:hypothetical protein
MMIVLLVGSFTGVHAQFGNLVVFAPKGELFSLYLGNTLQNNEPEYRVEANNPGGPSFKIRIVFKDPAVKEVSKLVFNKPQSTMYFKVSKNAKGAYILESTTSEWLEEGVAKEAPPAGQSDPAPVKKESNELKESGQTGTGATTSGRRCDTPMNDVDFAVTLTGISAHPFEGSQLSAAKKMVESHCITSRQVTEVMYIFDLEPSRLSFAKHAYTFVYDPDNYGEVKEALHSDKSKSDLDKWMNSKK